MTIWDISLGNLITLIVIAATIIAAWMRMEITIGYLQTIFASAMAQNTADHKELAQALAKVSQTVAIVTASLESLEARVNRTDGVIDEMRRPK